jgi:dUTPase
VIQRVEEVTLMRVDELSETSRGAGGFGSTGTGHASEA